MRTHTLLENDVSIKKCLFLFEKHVTRALNLPMRRCRSPSAHASWIIISAGAEDLASAPSNLDHLHQKDTGFLGAAKVRPAKKARGKSSYCCTTGKDTETATFFIIVHQALSPASLSACSQLPFRATTRKAKRPLLGTHRPRFSQPAKSVASGQSATTGYR